MQVATEAESERDPDRVAQNHGSQTGSPAGSRAGAVFAWAARCLRAGSDRASGSQPDGLSERRTVSADKWALLGGLRFLLASVVLCTHLGGFMAHGDQLPPILEWGERYPGLSAVFCFFIVSGYSIAASVDRRPQGFFLRRIVRIYPAYAASFLWAWLPWFLYPAHSITLPAGETFDLNRTSDVAMVMNAITLPCIVGPSLVTFWASWSLTCEIVYYAFAPVLKKASPWVVAALCCGSLSFYLGARRDDWPDLTLSPIYCLAWFWLIGWILYRRRGSATVPLIACVVIVALLNDLRSRETYLLLVLTVCALGSDVRTELPPLLSRVLSYLGEISYPLYLTHVASFVVINRLFGADLHQFTGVYFVAALAVAAAVYHLVELPCRRLAGMAHA